MLEQVADEIIFTSFHYKRSDDASNLLELSNHPNKRVEDDLEKLIMEAETSDMINVFCGKPIFRFEIYNLILIQKQELK